MFSGGGGASGTMTTLNLSVLNNIPINVTVGSGGAGGTTSSTSASSGTASSITYSGKTYTASGGTGPPGAVSGSNSGGSNSGNGNGGTSAYENVNFYYTITLYGWNYLSGGHGNNNASSYNNIYQSYILNGYNVGSFGGGGGAGGMYTSIQNTGSGGPVFQFNPSTPQGTGGVGGNASSSSVSSGGSATSYGGGGGGGAAGNLVNYSGGNGGSGLVILYLTVLEPTPDPDPQFNTCFFYENCFCIQEKVNQIKNGYNDPTQPQSFRVAQLANQRLGGRTTFGNVGLGLGVGVNARTNTYLGGLEGQPGGSPRPLRNRF